MCSREAESYGGVNCASASQHFLLPLRKMLTDGQKESPFVLVAFDGDAAPVSAWSLHAELD